MLTFLIGAVALVYCISMFTVVCATMWCLVDNDQFDDTLVDAVVGVVLSLIPVFNTFAAYVVFYDIVEWFRDGCPRRSK